MGNTVDTFDSFAQLTSDKALQSVEVKDDKPAETDESPARRPKGWESRPLLRYLREDEEGGYKTIWEIFQRGVKKFGKYNLFGTRKWEGEKQEKRTDYVWDTYEQANERILQTAAGLAAMGLTKGDNVGILSINRAEWAEFALALYGSGMKCVPLYATLGDNAVEFIINHADIGVILTNLEEYKKLSKSLEKCPGLKTIIIMDYNEKWGNVHEKIDEKMEAPGGRKIVALSKLRAMGDKDFKLTPPTDEDPCYIMYTSGTTGQPKGALLTHGNVVAAVANVPFIVELSEKDTHISYLPLAHIFETVCQVTFYGLGGAVGFYQGDVKFLTDDMRTLHPTFVPGVPRVFGRMYERVMGGAQEKGCVKYTYFKKKYHQQQERTRKGGGRDTSADEKVFKPICKLIGLDKTRCILTGAAPITNEVLEFLRIVTGAIVVQGYGMTESGGTIAVTMPNDHNLGHVGPPLPSCEIKLLDVPEMGYLHTQDGFGSGELLVRGYNIFKGYYKEPEATKSAMKGEWLCTGDIARWNPNGTLSIIDRRKNIFKLPQGEFVAVEKIESAYGLSPAVGQIWVYGNGLRSVLVGVVVPNLTATQKFCTEKGWWDEKAAGAPGSKEFIAEYRSVWEKHHADLKAELMKQLNLQSASLKGFEKVKDVLIETDVNHLGVAFTEENECMTPTFKLRRVALLKRYHEKLRQLFIDNGEKVPADEKWPGL